MSIRKIAASNKGVTLVLVMVILMVVTILANILIETAFQNYNMGKANGHTDYSYYAAESAIQKCIDILNSKCADPALADSYGISYSGVDENFAIEVTGKLAEYIRQLSDGGSFDDFDVGVNTGNTADIAVRLEYLGMKRDEAANPGKLEIEVGLTAFSDYMVMPVCTGDKKVYAKAKFLISVPGGFELRGPVYTIGDLMANNGSVNILGDVHVYGTSPEKLKSPKQYYYGGIFARSNSEIIIRGNAYSRSFIRTGIYNSYGIDSSRIYIYKDAIAQGLHIFGKGQRIAVLRNAHTFDDLEVNGEDSVLAVNGSYFGLSSGEHEIYHDNSSAIVNSATLHHFNSLDSQKSRIVINGAVMVNGGTFRIDEDGNTRYQIEDASLAWLIDNEYNSVIPSPLYKLLEPEELDDGGTYLEWLADNGYFNNDYVRGFGNLFQAYNPLHRWVWVPGIEETDPAFDNPYVRLNAWLNDIDIKRSPGSYNIDTAADIVNPNKVKGFCNYVLAANDRMHYMVNSSGEANNSQIEKADILAGEFIIDNIKPSAPVTNWNDYWSPYVGTGVSANSYYINIPAQLSNLKDLMISETSPFIDRMVSDSLVISGDEEVKHKSRNVFNKLENSLNSLILANPSNPYIIQAKYIDVEDDGEIDINHICYPYNDIVNNPWAYGKHFLFVNMNPELDMVLDGSIFNGIIFTTGRVILKNGAEVNGAIVAAGRGCNETGGVIGSAAEIGSGNIMPRVPRIKENGSNQNELKNGSYAAVYCAGSDIKINFPDPEPETGRQQLLDRFLYQDHPINLYGIF